MRLKQKKKKKNFTVLQAGKIGEFTVLTLGRLLSSKLDQRTSTHTLMILAV
jgi:hypothetical protein